jgi:hypothetical protein
MVPESPIPSRFVVMPYILALTTGKEKPPRRRARGVFQRSRAKLPGKEKGERLSERYRTHRHESSGDVSEASRRCVATLGGGRFEGAGDDFDPFIAVVRIL